MSLAGARIVVIDDQADLADNLREILEIDGATVALAGTAADGLEVAAAGCDVALVDVRLPDSTGMSLLPRLHALDPATAVVLITGHASIDDAIEAVREGAYAYVLKPFDSVDLHATVSRACAQVALVRRTAALQRELERREDELRTLVDTVAALLLVLDGDGNVIDANPAVAAVLLTPVETLIGQAWASYVPPRDRPALLEAYSQVRAGMGASFEGRVLRQHGSHVEERVIRWRLAGAAGRDGFRMYASGLDLTETRALERRTSLAEKLAAVGTVSAGLAHEIRNPLNAATLQLQLLERRLLKVVDAERAGTMLEPIGLVREELARLSRLVTEFLQFARPAALQARDTDLANVLAQVVELERPVARERGIALELHAPQDAVIVEADGERIKQIAFNLVRNAIEAAQSRVLVSVEVDGAGARIRVRDDGPGIPATDLHRIFEPFFTTKEGGTGLGMAIVHSLVERHGGHIEVNCNGGTEVVIALRRHVP
ncbi:MAG: response regulator [Deltaproteobacteria bacterium]|nr:response regulator [Deltaproteobacteria bacterium]MBK8715026.1 response regulator [Deltaproteobacteria bacterium]MBP7287041.1 response regulator [Nannocystaceae bacterium]